MNERLVEMLAELESALELVRLNVARIREVIEPQGLEVPEFEMQGFLHSEQMHRASMHHGFKAFNDDNLE